jgi:hypothetical protein
VFPERRVVHVYRPDRPRAELTPEQMLSGEDVLPGFCLPVAECL